MRKSHHMGAPAPAPAFPLAVFRRTWVMALLCCFASLLIIGVAEVRAGATTYTWDGQGADGLWNNATNWTGNAVPTSNKDRSLVFTGSANTDTTNNFSSYTFGFIAFDSGASSFTLNGNSFTLGGVLGITNNSTSLQTFNVTNVIFGDLNIITANSGDLLFNSQISGNVLKTFNGAANTTVNGVISGTAGVTKSGAGTLVLNGTNSYTGVTTVSAGVLQIANSNALGTAAGITTVSSGAALQLTGSITFAAEALTLNGGGVSSDGALRNVSGDNTYTGNITNVTLARINSDSGTLTLDVTSGSAVTIGTVGGLFGGSGNIVVNDAIAGTTGTLGKDGIGTLTLAAANTYTGLTTISRGTLAYGVSNALSTGGITISNSLALLETGAATLDIGSFSDSVGAVTLVEGNIVGTTGVLTSTATYALQSGSVSANLAGAVGVNKTTVNTVLLSGSNSFTGVITNSAGILRVANSAALGSTAGGTIVSNNAALELTNDVSIGTEALTLNGSGVGNGGALRSLGGSNVYGGLITLGAAARINSDADTLSITNTGAIGGAGFALTIGGAGNVVLGSVISNTTGGLTKDGAGTLTLTAASVYTGATTISEGAVLLSGSGALSASGAVNLSGSTAVLDITGATATSITNGSLTGVSGATLSFAGKNLVTGTANTSTTFSGDLNGDAFSTLTKVGTGTLTLAGNNNFSGGIVLGAGGLAGTTANLAGNALTLSNGTLVFDQSTNGAYSAVLSGTSGALAKLGTGTVTLGDANTYGGTTTIGGGAFSVGTLANAGTASSIGTNATIILTNGGTLDYTGGSVSINRGISLAAGVGGVSVSSGTTALTLSGVISNTGSLLKDGAGTLILGGANTYTGGTIITNGTLALSGSLATAGAINLASSGTVFDISDITVAAFTNSSSISGVAGSSIVLGGKNLVMTNTGVVSLDSAISGSGGVTKAGAGTLSLGGNNTYSGGTTLAAGSLSLGGAGALGSSGTITFSGGTLQYSAENTTDYSDRFSTAASQAIRIDTAGQAVTFANALTSSGGSLTKLGTGTLVLGAANTYTGGTTFSAGSLVLANSGALGTTGTISFGGGTLQYSAFNTTDYSSRFSTATGQTFSIDTGGQAVAFGAVLAGTGNTLTKSGEGTLTLSVANTYTGATTINQGALRAGNATSLGTTAGGVTVNAGGSLELSGGITVGAEALALNGAGIDDGGALRNISGNNTYQGVITLGSDSRIHSDAGLLTINSAGSVTGAFNLAFGGTGNITVSDAIATTTGALTKDGAGTLTLTVAATYTGGTTINAGTLAISGGNDRLANTGALTLNGSNAVFSMSTLNETVAVVTLTDGTISGSGTMTATRYAVENGSISASLAGSGGMTKTGEGTVTLSGANTFTGNLTNLAGTVRATTSAGALGAGNVLLAGGYLELANNTGLNFADPVIVSSNTTIMSDLLAAGAGVTHTLGALTNGAQTITILRGSNVTSGTAGVTFGAVTLNASGANYVVTNDAQLTLGAIGGAGNSFTVGGDGNTTITGAIGTTTGGVTKEGAGTLTLSAANTYTGTTAINGGTLSYGIANALSTGAVTINSNATLNVATFADSVGLVTLVDGTITGTTGVLSGSSYDVQNGSVAANLGGASATLAKTGSGTVVLSRATNSYGGTTTIGGGVLSVGTLANAGANSSIGTNATIIMTNGGVLDYTGGSVSMNRGVNLAGDGELSVSGATTVLTNAGVISNTGSLVKAGAGTLLLSASNTYTGATTINAGMLALSGAGRLSTNDVSLAAPGATLNISNITAGGLTNASLSGVSGSTVALGAKNLTVGGDNSSTEFAGEITGTNGTLTKIGTGTFTVSGSNSYTGATTIAGGALSVSADNNLGTAPGAATAGSITLSNGTLLANTGFTLNSNRGIALGTGGGTINVASGQNLSYAGNITGANTFAKTGAGTLTLSSSNAYTGMNTLSEGTLRAENAFALGSLGAGDSVTLAGARLELADNSGTTFGTGSGYGTIVSSNSTIVSDRLTAGAGVAQQIGTLSIGAQTLTVEKGANVSSGTATVVVGGATTLTGNATFSTAADAELRVNSTISGTFGITKSGNGILTLNGASGHANTTVNAGTLNINNNTALGTAAGSLVLGDGVTINNTSGAAVTVVNPKSISLGSSLNFTGSNNLNLGTGTATLSTNMAIDVAAGTLTFGGDMTGAFGLTKNGAGTLELAGLTGTNSFTGNSFINAGEIFLSGTSFFGGTTNTTVTVGTNAFLRIGASAGLGNVTLVLDNPNGLIISSVITNNVVFSNSGTISSTYANVDGSITIGSNVTMSAAANNLGTIPTTNTPGRIVFENNATLDVTTGFTINQNQGITLDPGVATISAASGQALLVASSIAGEGELRKTGTGNIRLTGSNSYTGGTVIEQGIIGITSDSSLGATSGQLKLDGGTVVAAQNNTGGPTNSGTTIDAARAVVLGNGTSNGMDAQTGLFLEYNGVIGEENGAGAAANLSVGAIGAREGTVKLGGLNTYDGTTTLAAGTLEAAHLGDGGTASSIGQSGNAASNLVIGGTLRYTGTNASTDRLFSVGSSGVATIDAGGGSLAFTNTGALGFAATNLTRHDVNLTGTGSGTMAVALVNDVHDDPLHVTKNGSGTWVLSGTNDYTGTTTINGGTLQVSADANLGRTTEGEGLVFNGGSLKTTGSFTNSRVVSLLSAATIDTDGNALGLAGLVSGTGALNKTGAGTLALSGANSFTGGATLSAGTLRVQNAGALGSGALAQSTNTTLVIDTTGTVTNAMSIYNIATLQTVTLSGAKTLNNATFDVAANSTYTETGALSGDGGIDKIGAGTLVLAGSTNNTYTGATVVEAGALVLSNSAGNAINNSLSITVESGASLILGASNQIADGIGLVLNGGTFITGTATAGYSETLGTLTLNANSTIDLGSYSTGLRQLTFADSSAITWTGTLTITNWQGMTRSSSDVAEILFGTGGLTSTQLGQIYFANQDVNGGLLIGDNGELVPIPEAEVYWAALAIVLAVGWRERRRVLLLVRQLGGGLERHPNPTER